MAQNDDNGRQNQFEQFSDADVNNPRLLAQKLNRIHGFLGSQIAGIQGTTTDAHVRLRKDISVPGVKVDSTDIPKDDKSLLSLGAAKQLFSPNVTVRSIKRRRWVDGSPVDSVAPSLDAPTQPTDWTVSVTDYGATVAGQPQAKVTVVINDRPTGATYFSVWTYKGEDPPVDASLYANDGRNNPMAESGATTIEFWVDREAASYKYQVVVTANGENTNVVPTLLMAVHEVEITAAGTVAQPSGVAVSVITSDQGGVSSGVYKVEFTAPVSDEFWLVNWDRIWCDNTFTPVLGAVWEHWGSTTTSPFTQSTPWPLPTSAEYWQFRAKSVTKSFVQNDAGAPTVNVTVPASSGISATFTVPAQPTSWTVAIADTGATVTGQPEAMLRVTVADRPAGTNFFSVWAYKGGSPPADLSQYENIANQKISAAGDTVMDFWRDRAAADETYQIVVTASGESFVSPAGGATVHSVVVTAAASIAQPTGIAVSVVTSDQGGVPSGVYKLEFTPPVSAEYWLVNWQRIWCDNTFTPVGGATWEDFASTENSPYTQPTPWSLPSAAEYWKFRAKSVTKAYVQNDTAPPTVDVTVPASTGLGAIASLAAAPPVENLHAETHYVVKAGRTVRQIHFWCDRPSTIGTFNGIDVFREEPDLSSTAQLLADGVAVWDGTLKLADAGWKPISCVRVPYPQSGTILVVDDLEPVTAATTGRLYIDSINSADVSNPLTRANRVGETPSVTYSIPVPTVSFGEGFEYAPCAAGFAFNGDVTYEYDSGGQVSWRRKFTVTNPTSDPRYGSLVSYDLMIEAPDGTRTLDSRIPKGSSSTVSISTRLAYPVPSGGRQYAALLVSVDRDGYQNEIIENITPRLIFDVQRPTGTGGTEYAPVIQVTAASWFIPDPPTVDGIEKFCFTGTWVVPTVVDTRQFSIVPVAELETGGLSGTLTGTRFPLAKEPVNAGGFRTSPQDMSDSWWTIWFVCENAAGDRNTIVAGVTPRIEHIHVYSLTTGGLKATRLDTTTFDLTEFHFDSGKFSDNVKSVDKLKVGSMLKVGGGPTQKAGEIGVFDEFDSLVAWAGKHDNGIGGFWHGIWAQNGWFGGTSPVNAPIQCSAAGVSLFNCTFSLVSGAVTVAINSTDKVKITDTATTRFAQITGSQFRMESTASNTVYTQIVLGAFQAQDAGFNNVSLLPTQLTFQGLKVIGPRLPAVSNPVGGVTIDMECRNALMTLLGRLRPGGHGLIDF